MIICMRSTKKLHYRSKSCRGCINRQTMNKAGDAGIIRHPF
jgi:hypothetical protein